MQEHEHTPRIITPDDTENAAGAVIEGLPEVRCSIQLCNALLGFPA